MKTQQFAAITMIMLFLSVGLLFTAGCGSGDSPAIAQQGASTPTDLSGVTQNWDKNLPAAQRFVVLNAFQDEAVRDNETGLVWERSPETAKVIWDRVKISCSNKNVGGRKGWRVPSVAELSSLVDPSVVSPGPTLSPGHPFMNIQSDRYWTATQDAVAPDGVWIVFFNNGLVAERYGKTNAAAGYVWCVRSPIQESPY